MISVVELEDLRKDALVYVNKFTSDQRDNKFHEGLSSYLSHLDTTEDGNAVRLYIRYGHLFKYVSEYKAFLVWTGKKWEQDKLNIMMSFARQTVRYIGFEALLARDSDKSRADDLWKWGKRSQSKNLLHSMLELVRSEPGVTIRQADLDTDDYLLNINNGTINLLTSEFLPHNPQDLITKIAPIDFQPGADCPEWCKFIQKISRGDQELMNFHQDLAGCGLVGKQLDDILVVNVGPGGNGKDVYSETLKYLLGDYAVTATSDLFLQKGSNEGISNDKARLAGVRFITASETDEGRKLNEAFVKAVTGGTKQTARFLHQEFFEYEPKFTLQLFTNHKPLVRGTDDGIWRRVKLVPWLHNFKLDPELETRPLVLQKMKAEASGILNWLLVGYQRRMQTKEIFVPAIVSQQTEAYKRASDILGEFLEDYCVTTEESAKITKSDLFDKYLEFSKEQGHEHSLTKRSFGEKLKERSDLRYLGEWRDRTGARYWAGIRLKEEKDRFIENKPEQKEEVF